MPEQKRIVLSKRLKDIKRPKDKEREHLTKSLEAAIATVEQRIAPKPNSIRTDEMEPKDSIRTDEMEPKEIAFLRAYSNYLTPRVGLFSSDTLALFAGYIRNLALTMFLGLVYVSAILAAAHFVITVLSAWIWSIKDKYIYIAYIGTTHIVWLIGLIFLFFALICISLLLTISSGDGSAHAGVKFSQYLPRLSLWLLVPSLPFFSGWLVTAGRQITFADIRYRYFLFLGGAAFICNIIGTFLAYLIISKSLKNALVSTLEVFVFRTKLRKRNARPYQGLRQLVYIVATFVVCVIGVFALIFLVDTVIFNSEITKFVGLGATEESVFYSVAFGPGVAMTGVWLIYVLWMGALGYWYSEFTREILNRIFGYLTIIVLLWLSMGGIIAYAQLSWELVSKEPSVIFKDYGFCFGAGSLLIAYFVVRCLRYLYSLLEMAIPRYVRRPSKNGTLKRAALLGGFNYNVPKRITVVA